MDASWDRIWTVDHIYECDRAIGVGVQAEFRATASTRVVYHIAACAEVPVVPGTLLVGHVVWSGCRYVRGAFEAGLATIGILGEDLVRPAAVHVALVPCSVPAVSVGRIPTKLCIAVVLALVELHSSSVLGPCEVCVYCWANLPRIVV